MPQNPNAEGFGVLSVGTRVLLKDVMDQCVRSMGNFRTHYAPTMQSALRAFSENSVQIMISEIELVDGSAYRLIQSLGGAAGGDDDLYTVVALEEKSDALVKLAAEIEAHYVLIKPITASHIEKMIQAYQTWKSSPKEPWQALLIEGGYSAREKKFREAEAKFLEALKIAPTNPVPYYKVGQYYLSKPDPVMAEKLLKKAVELKPDYVQAISALGLLWLNRREIEKADEYLKKAQQLSPLNPDRFSDLVRLNLERCAELCRSAMRLDPSNIKAQFHLGRVLALQKDYMGVVRELEKLTVQLSDDMKTEAMTFVALAKKLGGLRSG